MLSRRGLLLSAVAAAAPTRVLIIDGVNNHDWEAGTAGISSMLAEAGRFAVEVSTTPPVKATEAEWDRWNPQFAKFNVVVSNFNSGHTTDAQRWPLRMERAFEQYVSEGGGFVSFHAANNAFLGWPAYHDMIGLLWRAKEFGPGLAIDGNERLVRVPAGQGSNPGHGARHDFEMVVRDSRHTITRGLPKRWNHPSEQLTHGQHGPAQDLAVLTYAVSEVTHQGEPMDWVHRYGKGRVYATMLGHTWRNEANPNLESPQFRQLFRQGVQWAAGR